MLIVAGDAVKDLIFIFQSAVRVPAFRRNFKEGAFEDLCAFELN
jgi:hypothetical protein